MKGLKTLVAGLIAVGLLACAVPAGAGAAAYRHYVGCGVSRTTKPSHVCNKKEKKGAFFKATRSAFPKDAANPKTHYTICVRFPGGKNLCARSQVAKAETLYVNKITSVTPGRHRVTWFVGGKKVGSFVFRIKD